MVDVFGEQLPATFLGFAADILADTNSGLSGTALVRATAEYAVEYQVELPHARNISGAPNKRTALYDNLMAFSGQQQYRIILELCDHRLFGFSQSAERERLKLQLVSKYAKFAGLSAGTEVSEVLVQETRHWLNSYPEALKAYDSALQKLEARLFLRNLLDDLRLALECLLRNLLGNSKSLENQLSSLGTYINERGGSVELSNMFVKLIDYYSKYQNTNVKHNDDAVEEEKEFIFELTSAFMKHLVRLKLREAS